MHPSTRGHRRYLNDCTASRHKFIADIVWNKQRSGNTEVYQFLESIKNPLVSMNFLIDQYLTNSKFSNFENLLMNYDRYFKFYCSCRACRHHKSVQRYKENVKRRRLLKTAESNWEQDIERLE